MHQGLFYDLSVEPDNQAGATDREKDTGDPAFADPDQISEKSADNTADDTEDHILKNTA